ncbi:MAG: GTP-binding protein [Candidatus Baldrarchaeia archaeon]
MIVDRANKTIKLKIVYYGPAMSGKTTSLKALLKELGYDDHVRSVETTTGRTLFFDFGVIKLKFDDWTLEVNLWTATGQDYYAGTRYTILRGTDGVIFVADGQRTCIELNKKCWEELKRVIKRSTALLFCINKCDLNGVISPEELKSALGLGDEVEVMRTSAITGMGVKEAFETLLLKILENIG